MLISYTHAFSPFSCWIYPVIFCHCFLFQLLMLIGLVNKITVYVMDSDHKSIQKLQGHFQNVKFWKAHFRHLLAWVNFEKARSILLKHFLCTACRSTAALANIIKFNVNIFWPAPENMFFPVLQIYFDLQRQIY